MPNLSPTSMQPENNTSLALGGWPKFLLAVAVSLVTSGNAISAIFLDNLSQPHQYDAAVSYETWVASRFVTNGAAPAFELNSLTLGRIYSAASGGNFLVSIYSTGGTTGSETVGSWIGTLSGNSSPDTQGQYTYTASGITLQANTSYWMVTAVTSGSAIYQVSYIYDTTVSGGWTIPTNNTYAWSTEGGAAWNIYGGYWPYRYKIEATPIPEPGLLLLVPMGFGVLFLVRRKSNRGHSE